MITPFKWVEMILVVPVPLTVLLVNGVDFLIRPKDQRGGLFYFEQHTLKRYLAVHWLLVLAILLLILSWIWNQIDPAFQICLAAWFVYVNIHAMVSRRAKEKPTTASTATNEPAAGGSV